MKFEFIALTNFFHKNKLIKITTDVAYLPFNELRVLCAQRKIFVRKKSGKEIKMSSFNEFIIMQKKESKKADDNIETQIENVEKQVKPKAKKKGSSKKEVK